MSCFRNYFLRLKSHYVFRKLSVFRFGKGTFILFRSFMSGCRLDVRSCSLLVVFSSLVAVSCRTHPSSEAVSTPSTSLQTEQNRTLIIMYDAAVGKKPLMKAVKQYNARLLYDYRNFNGIAISLPDSVHIEKAIARFKKVKGVLSVQRDRKLQLFDKEPHVQ